MCLKQPGKKNSAKTCVIRATQSKVHGLGCRYYLMSARLMCLRGEIVAILCPYTGV